MLKNRETKRFIITGIILTAVICAAVTFFHIPAWIGIVTAMAAMLLLYAFDMRRRYSHMENMAQEIDLILHGTDKVTLTDYEEGDLSILKNEISKMTVMLRQQAERLSGEKVKLADSLADISHQIRTPLTSLNLMLADSGSYKQICFYLPAELSYAPIAFHTFCFIKNLSKASSITIISLIWEKERLLTKTSGFVSNWCDTVELFLNSGNSNWFDTVAPI